MGLAAVNPCQRHIRNETTRPSPLLVGLGRVYLEPKATGCRHRQRPLPGRARQRRKEPSLSSPCDRMARGGERIADPFEPGGAARTLPCRGKQRRPDKPALISPPREAAPENIRSPAAVCGQWTVVSGQWAVVSGLGAGASPQRRPRALRGNAFSHHSPAAERGDGETLPARASDDTIRPFSSSTTYRACRRRRPPVVVYYGSIAHVIHMVRFSELPSDFLYCSAHMVYNNTRIMSDHGGSRSWQCEKRPAAGSAPRGKR